jgi:lipopolysaccharide exporter
VTLYRQMAAGAAWMVCFKLVEQSIGVVSTIILARLLSPGDFGLVAMATAIIAALELFGAFNFDVAIIQKPNAPREHFDTAWTFNSLFGIFYAVVLLTLARPASHFYSEQRLVPVILWLALGTAVGGLENVGVVAFRKDLQFRKEFLLLTGKKVVAFCVTIPAALTLHSYWALVMGIIASRCTGVLLTYVAHPFRPRLSLKAKGELYNFSKWLFLNNLLNFLSSRSADFLVGRIAGSDRLGVYRLSYDISNLPSSHMMAPINRAVFPGYAKLSGDLGKLRESYLRVSASLASLTFPVAFGSAALASPLVLALLGPRWADCVPLIGVLAFFGALLTLGSSISYVCLAVGKPRLVTVIGCVQVAVLLPSLVIGLKRFGILGGAYADLISASITQPAAVMVGLRLMRIPFAVYARNIIRPLISSLVMYATVTGALSVARFAAPGVPPIAVLGFGGALGVVTYAGVLFLTWHLSGRPTGPESDLMVQLRGWIPTFFPRKECA